MSEVSSQIQTVTPGRGRKPVVLKNGTKLSDARKAANDAYQSARKDLTVARRDASAFGVAERKAARTLSKLENEASALASKKVVSKDAVKAAKEAVKTAKNDLKEAAKSAKASAKHVEKCETALAKADEARVKIENARLAAVGKTLN